MTSLLPDIIAAARSEPDAQAVAKAGAANSTLNAIRDLQEAGLQVA